MLLWEECGRRQLVPVVWYWLDICVQPLNETVKTLEIVCRPRFERGYSSNETELLTNKQGRAVPSSGQHGSSCFCGKDIHTVLVFSLYIVLEL